MVRFCDPAKVTDAALSGLMVAYVVIVAAAWANPMNVEPHLASLGVQAINIATVIALATSVATINRKAGCGSRWTVTWVTAGILTLNVLVRVVTLGSRNRKAKFVRWDRAAATVGTVATMAELYFALVPRHRFRIGLFFAGLVFVVPALMAGFQLVRSVKADDDLVRVCVRQSQKAYQKYTDKEPINRVLVQHIGSKLYVSFAGTEDLDDAKIDVSIGDVSVPPEWTRGVDARAHAGFVSLYTKLRRAIPRTDQDIVFTGHSLGGALATLAGVDAAANSTARVTVVTFGAPQVGDGNFVELFDATVHECVRVVNPYDPVTRLLGAQLLHTKGYYPVTSLTYDFPPKAHSLAVYEIAMNRPVWLRRLGLFAPVLYVTLAALVVVMVNKVIR